MRRISVALVAGAAVLSTSAAFAADLRVGKGPPPPPLPQRVVAPFNWNGCYIGGFVGGAGTDDVTATDRDAWIAPNGRWSYELDSSFIGGGTIGCNYQWNSPIVIGFEGEVGYINLEGSAPDPLSPGLDTRSSTSVGNWYGMITGRFGFAFDTALVYLKAGAAFVDINHNAVDACSTGACGVGLIAASFSDSVTTWTVGGGVELALPFLSPGLSVKAEYMFIALDDVNRACGVATAGPATGTSFCWDHDVGGIHTAKVGVNYRFWSPLSLYGARY